MLLELTIALTVLTVGLLSFLLSFSSNFRSTRSLADQDEAGFAFQRVVETLRSTPFVDLYSTYQGARIPVSNLSGPEGRTAEVVVTFYTNETTLSPVFGPVSDLNGDGVLSSTNVSTNYRLLPTRLSLVFQGTQGMEKRAFYTVLGNRG